MAVQVLETERRTVDSKTIYELEEQMRQARAARARGVVTGDQVFATQVEPAPKRDNAVTFSRTIGKFQAAIKVVPEALAEAGLATIVRFEAYRVNCPVQRAIVHFLNPVIINEEGITAEATLRGPKGKLRFIPGMFDPSLPFNGSKKAKREMKTFGAYLK